VSHGTPAGDAYLDLKTLAQRTDRPTEELLQVYVLEGFLARSPRVLSRRRRTRSTVFHGTRRRGNGNEWAPDASVPLLTSPAPSRNPAHVHRGATKI
jgi:hypothetical protein